MEYRRACWLVEQEEQEADLFIVDSEDEPADMVVPRVIDDSTTIVLDKPLSSGYSFIREFSTTPKMLSAYQNRDGLN